MMQQTQRGAHEFAFKRLSVRLLCLLAVVVVGLLITKSVLSSAAAKASPILSTAEWASWDSRYRGNVPYAWLANGDLAHMEKEAQGRLRICYQKMIGPTPSGKVRHGPLLPPKASPLRIFPSPDAQWVAYIEGTDQHKIHTVLVSADGKTAHTIGSPDERFTLWLPDSRSFLTLMPVPHFVVNVHHLDSPRTETITETLRRADAVPMSTLVTGTDFVLGGICDDSHSPTMTLRSFSMSQPAIVQQTWQADVPTDIERGVGYVSPDKRHILWTTSGQSSSAFTQWTADLIPAWRNMASARMRYFISNLRGEDRHVVLGDFAGGSGEIDPVWTPDSRHLSFLYKDKLWLIPVE